MGVVDKLNKDDDAVDGKSFILFHLVYGMVL